MAVNLDRIYTRGGDAGQTSLGRGERVAKHDIRVEAYGTVDETNSVIGLARCAIAHTFLGNPHLGEADAMLGRIQNDLFDVGADLCVPGAAGDRLRLTDVPALRLEAEVAEMNANLPALRSFILPGGTTAAAHAHLARTLVRRAERRVVALSHSETVNPAVIRYLNRLSDHLFVLGRHVNDDGAADVQWVPGANR